MKQKRVDRYREWLEAQGIRFGFAGEIADKANNSRLGVSNDIPPVELWDAILPTVRLLEKVREKFGPTTVNSAYRTTAYNIAVGGVGESQHTKNYALDFACANSTPVQWAAYLRELRAAGEFRGGIGTYKTFVHVDTRGTNADWTG